MRGRERGKRGREGEREREREGGREGGRERGREGERERYCTQITLTSSRRETGISGRTKRGPRCAVRG